MIEPALAKVQRSIDDGQADVKGALAGSCYPIGVLVAHSCIKRGGGRDAHSGAIDVDKQQ